MVLLEMAPHLREQVSKIFLKLMWLIQTIGTLVDSGQVTKGGAYRALTNEYC